MDPALALGLVLAALLVVLVLIAISRSNEQLNQGEKLGVEVSMTAPTRRPPLPVADDEKRAFYQQVHGVTFKNDDGSSRQRIIKECSVGEVIELVPEPDNRYDSDAVKVCRQNGDQLGYLPSGHRMAEGGELNADYRVTIEEIYPFEEKPRSRGCKLRIAVLKPTASNGLDS
jgi:hypothetical protein